MIDGSTLPYEENVALSKKVVEIAHAAGASVEAELGTMGRTKSEAEKVQGLTMRRRSIRIRYWQRTLLRRQVLMHWPALLEQHMVFI